MTIEQNSNSRFCCRAFELPSQGLVFTFPLQICHYPLLQQRRLGPHELLPHYDWLLTGLMQTQWISTYLWSHLYMFTIQTICSHLLHAGADCFMWSLVRVYRWFSLCVHILRCRYRICLSQHLHECRYLFYLYTVICFLLCLFGWCFLVIGNLCDNKLPMLVDLCFVCFASRGCAL